MNSTGRALALLCVSLSFSACGSKANPEVSLAPAIVPPVTIPKFDGLTLIQPKFSAELVAKLEALTQNENAPDTDKSDTSHAKKISREKIEESSLEKKIKELDQEIISLQLRDGGAREAQGKAELKSNAIPSFVSDVSVEAFSGKDNFLYDLSKDQKDQFSPAQMEMIESYKDKHWKLRNLKSDLKDLERNLSNLGYWDTYVSGKYQELAKQIEEYKQQIDQLTVELSADQKKLVEMLSKRKERNSSEALLKRNEIQQSAQELNAKLREREVLKNRLKELASSRQSSEITLIQMSKNANSPSRKKLEAQLARKKLEIIQNYASGEALKLETLLEAIVLQNVLAYENFWIHNLQPLDLLKDLAQEVKSESIADFKVSYEKLLSERLHEGATLVYNKDAFSILNPLNDNRMQCYSGTSLFLTLSEVSPAPHANKVVIMTEGHVLPGYIQVKDNALHLQGIETTSAGKGLTSFGATAKIKGRIRVFDAHQYLLVELFKSDLENFAEVYKSMMDTMNLYGFKTENFEKSDAAAPSTSDKATLNSSPLGFGQANVPAGDRERAVVDFSENYLFREIEAGAIEGGIVMKSSGMVSCEILAKHVHLEGSESELSQPCMDEREQIFSVKDYMLKKEEGATYSSAAAPSASAIHSPDECPVINGNFFSKNDKGTIILGLYTKKKNGKVFYSRRGNAREDFFEATGSEFPLGGSPHSGTAKISCYDNTLEFYREMPNGRWALLKYKWVSEKELGVFMHTDAEAPSFRVFRLRNSHR